MYQALYLKWRPARFDEVVGQEHITGTLHNAVTAGRLGHAYLFSGPRGTGKTTTARLLAKAANCLHEDLDQRPCGQCAPCVAVSDGRFLDLIEIDAASNTGVDDIRDLREKINFSPSEGRFKVYIIDEVHMLSTAAFNALLKTLEEPPAHAIFVLATTEEHKVPLTIKSRCQQFSFRLLTIREISGRLTWLSDREEIAVEPQAITMIAQQGQGSLRDAESLLDQLIAAPGDIITLERAQKVLGTASNLAVIDLTEAWLVGDGSAGLEIIHSALRSGTDPRQFTRQMVSHLRMLLLIQTAGREISLDVTEEQLRILFSQSKKTDRLTLIEALKTFNEAALSTSASWQPQLPLELAFIRLLPNRPNLSKDAAPGVLAPESNNFGSAETGEQPSTEYQNPETKKKSQMTVSEKVPTDGNSLDQNDTPSALESFSIAGVVNHWPDLREYVALKDRNLPALLASCKPLAVEGNMLILGFDYSILKDKFDDRPKARTVVCDGLSELLGIQCLVRTVVTNQYIPTTADVEINKDEFAALAEELGGVSREHDE
ncbi:MAG TPA: DNA polymerase III subunit gamma/tau [Patescibacteria group bacterium]|nr:DNA polymerase III subunit gamma/tau [Patescibacteria group bacterium]